MSGISAQAFDTLSQPRAERRRVRACIGLGSNLERPAEQLSRAFAALGRLPRSRLVARSSLYRSRPLGDLDQPDYLNAVAVIETGLDAHALLDGLQAIEAAQGRVRGGERWSARTLDLDLLVFGDERHDDVRLTVPHPELSRRDFVLYPLFEVVPELQIPGIGPLRDCLAACPLRGVERVVSGGGVA
jgi:2-amino-4-hydroxy-6-hydroxymethyldihydropteridine diphosphokinase